jgi:hypothetical protein
MSYFSARVVYASRALRVSISLYTCGRIKGPDCQKKSGIVSEYLSFRRDSCLLADSPSRIRTALWDQRRVALVRDCPAAVFALCRLLPCFNYAIEILDEKVIKHGLA